jgi:CBS domain containing-hemolysin-like protein
MAAFLWFSALVLLLAISFLFSGMETGVLSLNRFRLRQLSRDGDRRARLLNRYLAEPEAFLWTILVGNTLSSIAAAVMVLSLVHDRYPEDPLRFGLCGFGIAVVFYAVGEVIPKTLFGRHPNSLCLALITPFRVARLVLRPIVFIVELLVGGILRSAGGSTFSGNTFANREELRWLMQESGAGFTREERAMISRVMDLEKLTVRSQVMRWDKVISVESTAKMGEVLDLSREYQVTRMPVWERNGQSRKIDGILSLKRLLFEIAIDPEKDVADYVKPTLFIDEHKRLEDALQLMQKSGHRLAIVVDRDKTEIGILCLEDILSVIFGEVNL